MLNTNNSQALKAWDIGCFKYSLNFVYILVFYLFLILIIVYLFLVILSIY